MSASEQSERAARKRAKRARSEAKPSEVHPDGSRAKSIGPNLARLLCALVLLVAATPAPAQGGLPTLPATIGGQRFRLEVAKDPQAMFRGLGGRTVIPPLGGMLFAYDAPQPLAFVMRDCPIPIDVAFLDPTGRILNVHTMKPEPPRRPGESVAAYEARLPSYASAGPAQYAVELAGGRFAELGVAKGDRIAIQVGPPAP